MRAPARPGGKLRIGLGTWIAEHIIMPRLPDFMRRHPELAIECRLRLHVKDMHAEAIDVLPEALIQIPNRRGAGDLDRRPAPGRLGDRGRARG